MPSRIQELLQGNTNKINYEELIEKHPWIVEKNQYCVLSPDSDGLLCGLFMSKYLGWKITGFYDGKVAVINKNYLNKKLVFLDMEIFRKEIRSMGHHMLLFSKRHLPDNWGNFDSCIQPNNLRDYDGQTKFRLKYPLGTIHFLVGIVASKDKSVAIPDSAIPALFFTDGVFNVLFSYPENVLNWLSYLRINEDWNPLKKIFENDKFTVITLMKEMDSFFRKRDDISIPRERGDRLRISSSDGNPENIEEIRSGQCKINSGAKDRIIKFIKILEKTTTWNYDHNNWVCWENMKFYKFKKSDFITDKKTITIKNFDDFIKKNPLSWAMTSGNNIEYTIESPDKFF